MGEAGKDDTDSPEGWKKLKEGFSGPLVKGGGANTPTTSVRNTVIPSKTEASTDCVMRAVHTPLLGPSGAKNISWKARQTSKGWAEAGGPNIKRENASEVADMRNQPRSHGSPKFSVKLDRTPKWKAGKVRKYKIYD